MTFSASWVCPVNLWVVVLADTHLGAAFDSFFGFIFFAVAYWQLYKGNLFNGLWRSVKSITHLFILFCGLFLLGPGLYAAVEAIIDDYSGAVKPAFSCANVAI